MAEDKERVQQAADALNALGASSSESQAQPTEPSADAAPQDVLGLPVPAPVVRRPVRVTIKAAKPKKVKVAKPKKVEPPPVALTALQRAMLTRKIGLRRTVIPMLLTTGLAMVVLGCWGVVVLVGDGGPLEGGVRFETRHLARLMLLAWPIAAILLGGAGFFMHEVHRYYKGYGTGPLSAGTSKV